MPDYESNRETERRGPDPLALIAGVAALVVSAYVLTDGAIWIPAVGVSWLVAGGALTVGLIMLIASVRGRKR